MPSKTGLISPPDSDTPGLRDGRACRHCAQVKERCVPDDQGQPGEVPVCQRCRRLNKHCSTPAPVARKKPRLDRSSAKSSTTSPAPTPSVVQNQTASSAPIHATPTGLLTTTLQIVPAPPHNGPQTVSATLDALGNDFKTRLLVEFRDTMAEQLPFLAQGILLRGQDNTMTADAALCEQKAPFSFAAVCMSALHRHCTLQKRTSQEILASLATVMMLQGRKSLDLLYCILIIEAWYPFHVTRNPQMMNLLGLARALIIDMGLALGSENLPIRLWADVSHLLFGRSTGPQDYGAECRAVLGTYYIGAFFAITLRRSDFPPWHEAIERSCRYLESNGASDHDVMAIHAIRLLQLAEPYLISGGVRPNQNMGVRSYISCFRPTLDHFRDNLPTALVNDVHFQLDISCVEIAMYDRIIPAAEAMNHAETVEGLHKLLSLVDTYLDAFIAIPAQDFPPKTSISKGQMSQALEVLAKLLTLTSVPGWDLQYVRAHHSFSAACDRLVEKFEEVYLTEKELYPDMETSQFAIYPIKIRQRKKWFEQALAKEEQGQSTTTPVAGNAEPVEGSVGEGQGPSNSQAMGGAAELVNGMGGPGWEVFDDFLQWNYPTEDFTWP